MKHVIIRLAGGLGNQMFQYAAGLALARKLGVSLKVDLCYFDFTPKFVYSLSCFVGTPKDLNDFATFKEVRSYSGVFLRFVNSLNWYYKLFHKYYYMWPKLRPFFTIGNSVYREKQFNFDPQYFEQSTPKLVIGYFQSERYFSEIIPEIRKTFELPLSILNEENKKLFDSIKSEDSVSIHIRRGDYVSDGAANQLHGVCDLSYFYEAVRLIQRKRNGKALSLYVFSNSPEWAKENWNLDGFKVHFVTGNYSGSYDGIRDSIDLLLMSSCKDHVIANSSFSWWAAWLNNREDKLVVAPQAWFKDTQYNDVDIIPSHWIRLGDRSLLR
ncbi:MAG: alpha-1,2-fucosyltransferase [Xanthomonadaceae bacterium]|nr:alpha-1,2-fucosyltransferase [Xanthomonadaceae bacterium]